MADGMRAHQQVWDHFGCARASAYNYRRKVIAIFARRAMGKA